MAGDLREAPWPSQALEDLLGVHDLPGDLREAPWPSQALEDPLGVRDLAADLGIWAGRSIAGKSVTTNLDGVDIRLDFPDSPSAFNYPYALTGTGTTATGEGERSERSESSDDRPPPALEDQGGSCISIRVIRAVANVDAPDTLRAARSSSEAKRQYEDVKDRMRRATQLAFRRLEEWIRVDKKQVWMPPPTLESNRIGSEEMVDLDRQESLGVVMFAGGQLDGAVAVGLHASEQ